MRHQTPEVEDPQNQGWVTLWTLALLLSSLVFMLLDTMGYDLL